MLQRFPVAKGDFDGPVLITGAGGCIGSWALALLLRAGVPVVAYDLADDRRRPRLLLSDDELAGVPWVTGDIADTTAVARVVVEHRVRAIIHLAALQVPFCKADPVAGAKANVVGTVNVLEAARHHGVRRVAYASSIAALSFLPDAPWPGHALRRLQARQRADGAGLPSGLGHPLDRHPAGRGLRRRARSGPDLQDHGRDPRRGGRPALHDPVHRRGLGAARGRGRARSSARSPRSATRRVSSTSTAARPRSRSGSSSCAR